MRNNRRLLLVSLLISAGLYSVTNARLFVEKLNFKDMKALISTLQNKSIKMAKNVVVASEPKSKAC